ncbi:MAG: hypothetical protein VKN33_05335 [Candidatus Sericytochromatia bacterium]|nr:hypothetical protein [Candidatus Sericytochromatia bacterium]
MPLPWTRKIFILMLMVATAGCGFANPYGQDLYGTGGDPYGGYGDTSYDTNYASGGNTYDDPYGGSGYYSGDFSSGYTAQASTAPALSGSYGDFGAAYGEDAVLQVGASPRPQVSPSVVVPGTDESVLSAWVVDVKEPSVWGRLRGRKAVAKVEIENPGTRTLTGRLRVRFTDAGNPTGVIQTRRVTLAPKERQILSFTAQSARVDDAEALIETDVAMIAPPSQVKDR